MYTYMEKEIMQLRFPLKIWNLLNMPENGFIRWTDDRQSFFIDSEGLRSYLHGDHSVFRMKNPLSFHSQMKNYGFVVLEKKENFTVYQHPEFDEKNTDMFKDMSRRKTYFTLNRSSQNHNCFKANQKMTKQRKFKLTLELKMITDSLNEVYNSIELMPDSVPVIEIPDVYCDQPSTDEPSYVKNREIAGNYGFVDVGDLRRFFGNYVPLYSDSPEIQEVIEANNEKNRSR